MLEEMNNYETMLLPHLLQEEEEALPLMRAYFVPAEIRKLMQIVMKGADPVSLIKLF